MAWKHDESSPEVAIITPNKSGVSFDWAVKFSSLKLPEYILSSDDTAAIDLARERCTEKALKADIEWLFYLDSDVLPPENVYKLLRRHQLDVVSGVYTAGVNPSHPAAWRLDDTNRLAPLAGYDVPRIMEVDAVGLGCCLVHRRVLEDIKQPWFRWTLGYEEHPWDLRNRDDGDKGVGEDFYFCKKAKDAGYNIYIDTEVLCNHEHGGVLTPDGFEAKRDLRSKEEHKAKINSNDEIKETDNVQEQ